MPHALTLLTRVKNSNTCGLTDNEDRDPFTLPFLRKNTPGTDSWMLKWKKVCFQFQLNPMTKFRLILYEYGIYLVCLFLGRNEMKLTFTNWQNKSLLGNKLCNDGRDYPDSDSKIRCPVMWDVSELINIQLGDCKNIDHRACFLALDSSKECYHVFAGFCMADCTLPK